MRWTIDIAATRWSVRVRWRPPPRPRVSASVCVVQGGGQSIRGHIYLLGTMNFRKKEPKLRGEVSVAPAYQVASSRVTSTACVA